MGKYHRRMGASLKRGRSSWRMIELRSRPLVSYPLKYLCAVTIYICILVICKSIVAFSLS
jgi:hypothetical protein